MEYGWVGMGRRKRRIRLLELLLLCFVSLDCGLNKYKKFFPKEEELTRLLNFFEEKSEANQRDLVSPFLLLLLRSAERGKRRREI